MPTTHALLRHCAALLCACSLVAHAGPLKDYPFEISSEKTAGGYRLIARNAGPAAVSVRVAVANPVNLTTDRPFPLYVVIPAGGHSVPLGVAGPAKAGESYSFQLEYGWLLGDMNATQARTALYRLPYLDGSAYRVAQAPGGPLTTHNNRESRYAVDITMPEGTPIVAARAGTVVHVTTDQVYGGQSPDLMDKANEVRIQHDDGTIAVYAHFAPGGVHAHPGQHVQAGQQIGLAGSTGYSSGPHLHFAVQTVERNGDTLETVSLPFQFYVGTPPATFPPEYGMLIKADYTPAGQSPVSPTTPPGKQPAASDNIVTLGNVQITLNPVAITLYTWAKRCTQATGGLIWLGFGLVAFTLLLYRTRITAKRRQQAQLFRSRSF